MFSIAQPRLRMPRKSPSEAGVGGSIPSLAITLECLFRPTRKPGFSA
jgi:hypothetical protein